MGKVAENSIISKLMENLLTQIPGKYDSVTQTWSHREAALLSPVKHSQEN